VADPAFGCGSRQNKNDDDPIKDDLPTSTYAGVEFMERERRRYRSQAREAKLIHSGQDEPPAARCA
jgi:hypothetical protein